MSIILKDYGGVERTITSIPPPDKLEERFGTTVCILLRCFVHGPENILPRLVLSDEQWEDLYRKAFSNILRNNIGLEKGLGRRFYELVQQINIEVLEILDREKETGEYRVELSPEYWARIYNEECQHLPDETRRQILQRIVWKIAEDFN